MDNREKIRKLEDKSRNPKGELTENTLLKKLLKKYYKKNPHKWKKLGGSARVSKYGHDTLEHQFKKFPERNF